MALGPKWHLMSDEELLDVRLCDLPLHIHRTPLAERIKRLYEELQARGIRFRPHVWLGEEWFTPDGVPGIAIPFYLAHPRLEKLELAQMLEVEGGDAASCLRILRHEAGHAVDNAYRLRRRPTRRRLFASPSTDYPEYYLPKPYSKKREHYGLDYPHFYDSDLRNLFSSAPEYAKNGSAARFVRKIRKEVRSTVASFTDSYQYTIDQLLEKIVERCREQNLRLTESEEETKIDFIVFLTVQTMNYLHGGRHRVAL